MEGVSTLRIPSLDCRPYLKRQKLKKQQKTPENLRGSKITNQLGLIFF